MVMEGSKIYMMMVECCMVFLSFYTILHLLGKEIRHNKWLIVAFTALICPTFFKLLGEDRLNLVSFKPVFENPTYLLVLFPSIYLYIKALVFPRDNESFKSLLHYIPFLLMLTLSSIFHWVNSDKLQVPEFYIYIKVLAVILLVYIVVYGLLISKMVHINQKKYQTEFANENIFVSLSWIKYLVIWVFAFFFFGVVAVYYFPDGAFINRDEFIILTVLLSLTGLSYFSIRQETLFIPDTKDFGYGEINGPDDDVDNILPQATERKAVEDIEKYMKEHRPYLNPTIRMHELAETLDIPRHVFSKVINEYFHMNFFHFVNHYRVQYVLDKLNEENLQKYTIETIAIKAGFNSKSTFYKSFKEITGETPGTYVKRIDTMNL